MREEQFMDAESEKASQDVTHEKKRSLPFAKLTKQSLKPHEESLSLQE